MEKIILVHYINVGNNDVSKIMEDVVKNFSIEVAKNGNCFKLYCFIGWCLGSYINFLPWSFKN